MTESIDIIVNVAVAAVAGIGGVTRFGTGRHRYNGIIAVTECGDDLLRFEDFIAYRAFRSVRKTFGRTGWCIADNRFGAPVGALYLSFVTARIACGIVLIIICVRFQWRDHLFRQNFIAN